MDIYIWKQDWKKQSYFLFNDRSHSDARPLHGESGFRDTTAAYVHYRANGPFATCSSHQHVAYLDRPL